MNKKVILGTIVAVMLLLLAISLVLMIEREEKEGSASGITKYWELYMMDVSGSNITRLTNNLYFESQPDVSHDGSRIVAAVHYAPKGDIPDVDPGWELAVVDLQTKSINRITSNNHMDFQPHWNHNSTRITYTSTAAGERLLDIYTINPDGTGRLKLTDADSHAYYFDPSFSNTDNPSRIVYVRSAENGNGEIWIMNEDGSGKHKVVSAESIGLKELKLKKYLFNDPMFSPQDNKIVFSLKTKEKGVMVFGEDFGIYDIFTADIDGTNVKRLTFSSQKANIYPQISPDGLKILFNTITEGGWFVAVMGIDGDNEIILSKILSVGMALDQYPTWVDEKRIIFQSLRDAKF